MADDQLPPFVAPSRRESLRRLLHSREALRQAFLLREILGPPVGLRDSHRDPGAD